jgi:hypothetical protein
MNGELLNFLFKIKLANTSEILQIVSYLALRLFYSFYLQILKMKKYAKLAFSVQFFKCSTEIPMKGKKKI